MEDEEDQERVRDKFKRERDDEASKEVNLKRERNPSPSDRGRKREKYDDFGRISRDAREGSADPLKERERSPERERSRERSRERGPERDSYRPPNRGYRRNYRDLSPDRGRGRRESPPPFKRRRREDDWDPRGFDRYGDRGSKRMGRPWSGDSDSERSKTPRQGLFEGNIKTYKHFLEVQDDSITPEQAEKKYEEYKAEFKKRQAKTFFEEHKSDEWFKEKYEPTFAAKRRLEKIENSKKNFQSFMQDLNSGKDFNLNAEDHPEFAHKDDKQEMQLEDGETEPQEEGTEEGLIESKQEEGEEDKAAKVAKTPKIRQSEKLIEPHDVGSSRNEPPSSTLFIKTVPPSTGKADLVHLFSATEGFQALSLSEPMRFKNYHRIGWATYDTPDHCSKALSELNGRKLKDFDLMLAINKNTIDKKAKITPPVASEEARIAVDLEMTKKLCEQLDREKEIDGNPLVASSGSESSPTVLLDQRVAYLRRVHFLCYYCGEEYEDEEDLKRRCGLKHLRGRNKDAENKIDAPTDPWASSLDQKTKHRIDNPDNPDVYTAKHAADTAAEDFLTAQTTKIGDDKFRCAICSKLFAADHFVRKHLQLKHDTEIAESKKQAVEKQYFENYFSDPKRIVPSPQGNSFNSPGSSIRGGNDRRDQRPGGRYSWPPPSDRYDRGYGDRGMASSGYRGRGGYINNRGRGGSLRGSGRPFPDRPPGRLEPPHGVTADPRGLREYVDLDAPEDEPVAIDYRTSLPEPEREDKDD